MDETPFFCYNVVEMASNVHFCARWGKVVGMMAVMSAVLFVPDDTGKTEYPRPLMLTRVLGVPLLAWLANALFTGGVGRFFLVCHERFVKEAVACLPEGAEIMTSVDSVPADLLHVFLSTADDCEQTVDIIAAPALYLPHLKPRGQAAAGAFRVSREALMTALDEKFSFTRFMRENCTVLSDSDGFYAVDSPEALPEAAELLRRDRALGLIKKGVQLDDPANCIVEPTVCVEKGARLLSGTILRGKTLVREGAVIGPWSVIADSEIGAGAVVNASQITDCKLAAGVSVGPYSRLRDGAVLERGAAIGNFVEIKNSHVGENTRAAHLTYLGDAQIGADCNFGCGSVTVNFDRKEKHPTSIGEGAFIGCNASLVAPVRLGNGAFVAAGSVITEDVPDNALAIARARQSVKKDWAKNK